MAGVSGSMALNRSQGQDFLDCWKRAE